MLCYAMLCYATLCYDIVHYPLLYHATLSQIGERAMAAAPGSCAILAANVAMRVARLRHEVWRSDCGGANETLKQGYGWGSKRE